MPIKLDPTFRSPIHLPEHGSHCECPRCELDLEFRVMSALGLKPWVEFRADALRRGGYPDASGRTTKMIVACVRDLIRGRHVLVVAHDKTYARKLADDVVQAASRVAVRIKSSARYSDLRSAVKSAVGFLSTDGRIHRDHYLGGSRDESLAASDGLVPSIPMTVRVGQDTCPVCEGCGVDPRTVRVDRAGSQSYERCWACGGCGILRYREEDPRPDLVELADQLDALIWDRRVAEAERFGFSESEFRRLDRLRDDCRPAFQSRRDLYRRDHRAESSWIDELIGYGSARRGDDAVMATRYAMEALGARLTNATREVEQSLRLDHHHLQQTKEIPVSKTPQEEPWLEDGKIPSLRDWMRPRLAQLGEIWYRLMDQPILVGSVRAWEFVKIPGQKFLRAIFRDGTKRDVSQDSVLMLAGPPNLATEFLRMALLGEHRRDDFCVGSWLTKRRESAVIADWLPQTRPRPQPAGPFVSWRLCRLGGEEEIEKLVGVTEHGGEIRFTLEQVESALSGEGHPKYADALQTALFCRPPGVVSEEPRRRGPAPLQWSPHDQADTIARDADHDLVRDVVWGGRRG